MDFFVSPRSREQLHKETSLQALNRAIRFLIRGWHVCHQVSFSFFSASYGPVLGLAPQPKRHEKILLAILTAVDVSSAPSDMLVSPFEGCMDIRRPPIIPPQTVSFPSYNCWELWHVFPW